MPRRRGGTRDKVVWAFRAYMLNIYSTDIPNPGKPVIFIFISQTRVRGCGREPHRYHSARLTRSVTAHT